MDFSKRFFFFIPDTHLLAGVSIVHTVNDKCNFTPIFVTLELPLIVV